MITKAILAERILRKINGGDYATSKQVDKRDVYLEIEACRNTLISKYLNIEGDDINGDFISTYTGVKILKDKTRNRLYSVLPAQVISLRAGKGIRQISGAKDERNVYIPMNAGDMGVFAGLEAEQLGGKIGFWLEGDKVYYNDNMPFDFEGHEVLIKMISSIYALPEDAWIPIPAEVETELQDLVMQKLAPQDSKPKDKTSDNNAAV